MGSTNNSFASAADIQGVAGGPTQLPEGACAGPRRLRSASVLVAPTGASEGVVRVADDVVVADAVAIKDDQRTHSDFAGCQDRLLPRGNVAHAPATVDFDSRLGLGCGSCERTSSGEQSRCYDGSEDLPHC